MNKHMIRVKSMIFSLAMIGMLFMACNDDDPVIQNEEEVITTLTYTLSPSGGGADLVFSFLDLDGDGGVAPTILGGTLQPNEEYTATITAKNQQAVPEEDITAEILEEAVDHQFFFQSTVSDIVVEYDDQDENGQPLGIKTKVKTGSTASGTLTITLRHEPNKTAAGVANGEIANAGGETDIEVVFPINVE